MTVSASVRPAPARASIFSSAAFAPDLGPVRRAIALLGTERADILTVLVFAVAVGILSLATPVAVQAIVGTIAFGTLLQPLVVLAVLLFAVLVFAMTLRAMQAYVVEILERRVFVRVATALGERLPRLDAAAHEHSYVPELVNRFFDVLTVQKSAAQLILEGLSVVLGAGVGLVVLGFYHPALLAFDALLLTAIAIVVFPLGRKGVVTAIAESKKKYAVAAALEDIARAPLVYREPGARRLACARVEARSKAYVEARAAHFRVVYRQMLGAFAVHALASTGLLALGAFLVIERELTLGQLVGAELIVTLVVAGLLRLSKYLQSWYDLVAAVDKIGKLVWLPLERATGDPFPTSQASPPTSGIEVRARKLRLARGGHTVLDAVDFHARPGERVVIVGPVGSGKSTWLDAVAGTIEPSDGTLSLDGVDVRDIALDSLRGRVALVRSTEIIEGTLRDNVVLGRSVPIDRLHDVITAVGLEPLVARLPHGLDSALEGQGGTLSHGERVQIAFARWLVTRPALLLVDGLLDGLDGATKSRLVELVFGTDAHFTAIVVTQDPGIRALADQVLALDAERLSRISPPAPTRPVP